MPTTASGPQDPGFEGMALSPRAFWGIFWGAWLMFAGLFCSAEISGGVDWKTALLYSVFYAAAPSLPALVVAMNRRRLLAPRPTIWGFVRHKVLVGSVYALTYATLAMAFLSFGPTRPEMAGTPQSGWFYFVGYTFVGGMLYAMLLAFLMWADSLERVRESQALAAREAVLRAQAEAKALRSRFNPHFVFNTLHSLMLLVREEPATAERAIEDVAELIRYASTLERREIDQVTLAKELEFARRYVSLEKLRLEERLSVAWDIDESLENVLVPAFSLQTLLENAIKHGVSTQPDGGAVCIHAHLDNGDLALSVVDDGAGADTVQVGSNGGSGLDLLERRLAVVYGGEGSLTWTTAPDEGFAATVRVPVRRTPAGRLAEAPDEAATGNRAPQA